MIYGKPDFKIQYFLGQSDDICGARGPHFRPMLGDPGVRAGLKHILFTLLKRPPRQGLTMIYGKPFIPDGISVGMALAPTSVGVAFRLLGESKVLKDPLVDASEI